MRNRGFKYIAFLMAFMMAMQSITPAASINAGELPNRLQQMRLANGTLEDTKGPDLLYVESDEISDLPLIDGNPIGSGDLVSDEWDEENYEDGQELYEDFDGDSDWDSDDGFTDDEDYFEEDDAKYDHIFSGRVLLDEEDEEDEEDEAEEALSLEEIAVLLESEEYADIAQFPAGYQAKLVALKQKHPNWTFKAVDTGLDFETAVKEEYGDRSWIYVNDSNAENDYLGKEIPGQKSWRYANERAIRHYMDPRNFLSEKYIFQFEQLTYNATVHTVDVVQNLLSGTFMRGKIPGDSDGRTYAQAFYTIGKKGGISPVHLAARVYQEQGAGTSPLISGESGYYNYFNVGATGKTNKEIIENGLAYARKEGWNTRYKSLEKGANIIGAYYIKKKQNTLYYEKFNVVPNNEYNATYNHQYMQNVQAAASEATSIYNMYNEAKCLNSSFAFIIPVYRGMGGLKLSKSSVNVNIGDTATLTLTENNSKVESSKATWTSSNKAIATVSNGVVTGVKPGQAVITATYGGNSVACTVNVKSPIQSISLDHTEDTMRRSDALATDSTVSQLTDTEKQTNHDRLQLTVKFSPVDTTDDKGITWTTSNKKVATVDANGLVKAVGAGDCTITAVAKANVTAAATCEVHVIAPITGIRLTDPAAEQEMYRQDGTEIGTQKPTTVIAVGQRVNLSTEYWPKNTTDSTAVVWTSSKPTAATVEDGVVTGVAPATSVTIKAAIKTDYGTYYSDTYTITVANCNVTFMKRSGSSYEELKAFGADYGGTITLPNAPDIAGESFVGWYTQPEGCGSRFDEHTVISAVNTTLYPYYEEGGRGFFVEPIGDVVYTGKAVTPSVRVYDSVAVEGADTEYYLLTEGVDYKVTYKNNKAVAASTAGKAPYALVTGKGNYSGKATTYFSIVPMELGSASITAADVHTVYNGKTIAGEPVVTRDGKALKKNTDYTLSYPQKGAGAYQLPGTYPIVISGRGGYSGSITVMETIVNAINMSTVTVGKIDSQQYNQSLVDSGSGMCPQPNVYYKKELLKKDVDYTLSYSNNKSVGTATVIISAVEGGRFSGSKQATFKITGINLAGAKIYNLKDRIYTGSEEDVKQEFGSNARGVNSYVTLGEYVLQYSDDGIHGDYTVSYKNINGVGKATVQINGINGYTGLVKAKYSISAYNMATDDDHRLKIAYLNDVGTEVEISDLSEISIGYHKKGAFPQVVLYDTAVGDKRLVNGKDYKVSISRNSGVSTDDMTESQLPYIKVSFKGNYIGSSAGNFRITPADMKAENVKLSVPTIVYKSKPNVWKAVPVLTDVDGKKLKVNKDYVVTGYEYAGFDDDTSADVSQINGTTERRSIGDSVKATDIPDAGTEIKITITGAGNYKQQDMSYTYRIVRANLGTAKIKIYNQIYNHDKPITIAESDIQSIRVNGVDLVEGVDYIIDSASYKNNRAAGKASVELVGIGNYGGRKVATYTITGRLIAWWRSLL